MSNPKRPFNPVITSIGDSFVEGQKPTVEEIDLSKLSDSEVEKLAETHVAAMYELFWRGLSDGLESE